MPSPQVDQIVNQLLQILPQVKSLDAAVVEIRQGLDRLLNGLSKQLSPEIEEAREIVAKQFENIEILRRHSVITKKPKWYFGPKPTDLHWPAVRAYMINAKGWHEDDVKATDESSSEVVSLLESPIQSGFSCRGLVVGYVQSGKTANMTAVIAKALDAGYNTIIVLAGLTNKLRYQTQVRLFEDLCQRNPLHWQVLTPNDVNRDFRAPPQGGFLAHSDKAQIAIIKKNVSPLKELKEALQKTLPAVLEKLRILVIDDECDQASVNSAQGEMDMTAINQWIREILAVLPAVTYVGYTATPFANVLINPYRIDGQELDDLYPRDFITALPCPERYFGTERLFGREPEDANNVLPDEDGLDMIRDVPKNEEVLLQPRSRQDKENFHPEMTNTLKDSVLYFLACCAARRARGQEGKHMTMLVHTSAYVVAHERVASLIQGWIEINREEIANKESNMGKQVEALWAKESDRLPTNITTAPKVGIDQIFEHLPAVLDSLAYPVENGSSEDRINYEENAKTYIVVGGSILARGLTLEGLMVSYFLRTANQYDTLLQMGRWFGYRPGYEDLPRIWMPRELKLRFRALASIEQEIRDDIEQYRIQDMTPMDIAVRIRSIPGMAVTGATKMKSACQCAISYWGTHRQTFRFYHQDGKVLQENWSAAAELLSRAEALGLKDKEAFSQGRKIWRGVPRSSIQRFFETYVIQSTHVDLQRDMLLPFVMSDDARLDKWNVGVVESTRSNKASSKELGAAGNVSLVSRAKLNDGGDIADIKALMSKVDIIFDCHELAASGRSWNKLKEDRLRSIGQTPLLLLYPIDKESKPRDGEGVRASLDAVDDIIGVGIVFPGSVTEGGSHVSIELRPLSADEIEEVENEEQAQAEAAGVI